ncbi:probable tRNA pseudouridine synthase 1 isoform X1 [Ictalurus furcatus]|uniref:probable tRNA pseudouridine synthase 1 isoform X1 n=1 Tax=Ictalurus furcatus TaxID=66913 RepID=UPI00234FC089|nr:probable tRNA pseudouridine synthase 1 isoform X1 [Ictalurus furcatus]
MAAVNNVSLTKLQSLNGIFSIYKKSGPTSADVLNTLKQMLLKEAGVDKPNPRKRKKQAIKLGHGGTLDSAASGVLVVGIGEGTKMLTSMLAGSKKYIAVGELGKATDTFDATGSVVQEKSHGMLYYKYFASRSKHDIQTSCTLFLFCIFCCCCCCCCCCCFFFFFTEDHITREAFEEKLKQFTGEIMQVPPLYSALKKDGKRLSTLLKEGQEVEAKPARPVTVYSLSLQDFNPPLFTLDVECGGGFYVRSLVDDLGKALSSCAHVRELTRTKQGQFTLQEHVLREERWTFQDISEVLQPCSKPAAVHNKSKKSKRQDAASQLGSERAAKDLHHSSPDNVGEDRKHSSD